MRLRQFDDIGIEHAVWSERPYKVFLDTPQAVRSCVMYVESNPEKEGLAAQVYRFVQPYNNWPFHKQ